MLDRYLEQDDVNEYQVVAAPICSGLGCWAGAPSAYYDDDTKTFYLVYRVRVPERRGYESRIATSYDGINFETVRAFANTDFDAPSIERSCIVKDPLTGKFKLYLAVDHRPWLILKLEDVADVRDFDPYTAYPVLERAEDQPDSGHVKDPYVMIGPDGDYWMYYIGSGGNREELCLATSTDGEIWTRSLKNPIMRNFGWHDFFTRPACVLPVEDGWAFYYEGSGSGWFDNVFNVQTGIAFTSDLETLEDCSPDAPALVSATSTDRVGTLRYMSCVVANSKIYAYYEAVREDEANELRVSVIG